MTDFDELIQKKSRGSLKVYVGYAPGGGKTYEMLQEGHRLKDRELDLVVGFVETYGRQDTRALLEGLEKLPVKIYTVKGQDLPELDLEAIYRRKPELVLVDELAHTNAPGSKNEKRYQDILEILDHGINVISTMNVQHLESVAGKVTLCTLARVDERIPDQVFRRADQIVFVDVSMEDLRERLRVGKIYEKSQAEHALIQFFTYDNLSFLREICLREVACDQFRKIEQRQLLKKEAVDIAQEAVMVALSSDPSHAQVLLRKATRLAAQISTSCYAVYVQKIKEHPIKIDSALQLKLQNNLKMAKDLGAEVITLEEDNIVEALVNFAVTHHVKHAVFGKSRRTPLMDLVRGSVILQFIHDSVGIDVHIVTTTAEEEDVVTS
jgi:two-component system sensor histidine kinase KdpD